jgi:hypothetical protein
MSPEAREVRQLEKRVEKLLAAAKRALNLLEMSGSGKLAKTPAADDLREAIAFCEDGR